MNYEQTIKGLLNEIKMLETLNKLNLESLHEIADQRDKYYEELQTLKKSQQEEYSTCYDENGIEINTD